MNHIEVIQMMADYYGKQMSEQSIGIYIRTLKDIPVQLLNLAAEHIIKTGKPFMPRVVELRRTAQELERSGAYTPVDPLTLIPGAAMTEEDLDERYGTIEEHLELCEVFASGGELSGSQTAVLQMGSGG